MQKKANKYYELKNRYQNLLYKISFDILNNRLRAERVVIKALESLSRHLGSFDQVESYRTAYLAVMLTKDISMDELEKAEDIQQEFDGFSETDEFDFFEVDTYSILRALEDLPERYSFILVLRYEYGFDDKGMADLLNTHPANIRSELCRAISALNHALDDLALSGAKRQENAKDAVCMVLPSFVNNLGASFLDIECEEQEFSEEYDYGAVYTPPAPKRYEPEHTHYVSGVVFIVAAILFTLMIFINPNLFTDIGLVKPESKISSSSKATSVATTSEPFVFTPLKPEAPQFYTLYYEETTENTYCVSYFRKVSNLHQKEITVTQTLYDPNVYEEAKKYKPKYLRDFPHKDTLYYEKDGSAVVTFHYVDYTFVITFEPSELDEVLSVINSIIRYHKKLK